MLKTSGETRPLSTLLLVSIFQRIICKLQRSRKERFAIVQALRRADSLVSGHTVSVFTDHANLVHILQPLGQSLVVSRHTTSKLMRWAIKLSALRYVAGQTEDNAIA